MSKNHSKMTVRNWMYRGFTGILCLVLLLGVLPGTAFFAAAEEETDEVVEEVTENWATPYMNQLVNWGVMRGDIDGNLYPERNITRAEFVTMMNRAYGYDETGGNPFTDVFTQDWYYDDIDIAYNVGYFSGTSPTTATPNGNLSREQATVLLARNMMLQGTSGEALGFSDSRELSEWSRGLVGAAAETGVINGYTDGSFRPQNDISRGEVAAMLSRAVGTLIDEPGSQSLGGVYGNLTINSSNVSLRDTTIVGNLYLTGGIGLGDVLLENVDVYGEIIVAGAGESNSSQSSVVLRNVTANELIVDNISNQFVTVRAEGDTLIPKTSVRTNAYIEDTTDNSHGLSYIELDGEQGTQLQLAGNIKEVKNLTPLSSLEIVQGSAAKVTADEHATGSVVRIDAGARVNELNLDVGASVSGDGDIGTMNVGAAGTNVGILPDSITVRPGITSNITGTTMNNVTAAESSADPRLLSGYPAVRNVAPNSATLVFSTNKAGTVYWAISALADGSVSEDDLISNPVYGGNIFRSGTINAANSKTEYTAQVAGLTVNGSYYVTAMLVDSRGNHSPLKVTAFSTPDNTTPAFTAGYPVMTRTTTKTAQVTVMTNKSCQMFYALLPRSSSTPSVQEFKSGAVSGNLGYGVVDVVKNNTQPVNVNSVQLEELTNYTLYLWLNDYDNARSSGVRAINFSTPDETPPIVTDIMQTNAQRESVNLNYTLNERGYLYWAIVVEGNNTFMNYELNTIEAKVKVQSGSGALRYGSSRATNADTAINMAITGLRNTGTSSYDVYYIAMDDARNYAETVGKITVRTLDSDSPTVEQEFTKYNDDNVNEPLADTDIRLVFSESVQGGSDGKQLFMDLYNAIGDAVGPDAQAAAREELANALREHIKMYRVPTTGQPFEVPERTKTNQSEAKLDWTIDYRFATVSMEEGGKMVITFPTRDAQANPATNTRDASALNLESGATYYFHIEGIYDNALTPNAMGGKDLDRFRTVFARVSLSVGNTYTLGASDSTAINDPSRVDFNFVVDPISVDRVDEEMRWDMLIWTDTTMEFTLYSRKVDAKGDPLSDWKQENKAPNAPMSIKVDSRDEDGFAYVSLTKRLQNPNDQRPDFPTLYNMEKTEYAIHIDSINESKNFSAWNHNVTFKVSIVAGARDRLNALSTGSFKSQYDAALNDGAVSIGTPDPFQRRIPFTDSKAPEIETGWPTITVGDISATVDVMLDRPGRVYWIVFPANQLKNGTTLIDNSTVKLSETVIKDITDYSPSVLIQGGSIVKPDSTGAGDDDTGGDTGGGDTPRAARSTTVDIGANVKPLLSQVPRLGVTADGIYRPELPTVNTVTSGGGNATGVTSGTTNSVDAGVAATINLTGLSPNTVYFMCMVTRGTAAIYSDSAICYRFTTLEAVRPTINVRGDSYTAKIELLNNRDATIDYFLALNGEEGLEFQDSFNGWADPDSWGRVVQKTNTDAGSTNPDAGSKEADDENDEPDAGSTNTGNGSSETYSFTDGTINFQFSESKTKMSVIDAMAIPCYDGGTYVGSVFDKYASTSAKNTYGGAIRSSTVSGNNIVYTSSGDFYWKDNGSTKNNINCDQYMQAGVLYTFVTVGKSSEGSGDAFRAYYSLYKGDTTPPMVASVLFSGGAEGDKANATFKSGSKLIVNFSEQLYVATSAAGTATQTAIPLDNCAKGVHSSDDNKNYKAVGDLLITPIGFTSIETESTHSSANTNITQLVFNLDDKQDGATITFPSNMLCDQPRNGITRNSLSIIVKIVPTSKTVVDTPAQEGMAPLTHVEWSYDVVLTTVTPAWRDSGFTTNMTWSGK